MDAAAVGPEPEGSRAAVGSEPQVNSTLSPVCSEGGSTYACFKVDPPSSEPCGEDPASSDLWATVPVGSSQGPAPVDSACVPESAGSTLLLPQLDPFWFLPSRVSSCPCTGRGCSCRSCLGPSGFRSCTSWACACSPLHQGSPQSGQRLSGGLPVRSLLPTPLLPPCIKNVRPPIGTQAPVEGGVRLGSCLLALVCNQEASLVPPVDGAGSWVSVVAAHLCRLLISHTCTRLPDQPHQSLSGTSTAL